MRLSGLLTLCGVLWLPGQVQAQPAPCPPDRQVASIEALEGDVRLDGAPVRQADLPLPVCGDSVVSTGAASRVQIHADGADTGFRLDENSSSRLRPAPGPESGIVDLLRGGLFFLSQVRRSLTVNTPYMTAGVEGTEVLVRTGAATGHRLELSVYDGRVALSPVSGGAAPPAVGVSAGQRLTLQRDGTASIADMAGGAAGALRLAAGRELAWTLYYPPLADDPGRAFPPDQAAAARLLAAGRAEEAQARLARIADGSAAAPTRDALLAMVALAQGQREKALELAQAAVGRRPDSAPLLLARSYAEQSLRQLDAARDSAQRATQAPDADGLAWARLAEVAMMFGEVGAAADAARRSAAIGRTPLAQTILGFTDLANFQAGEAERRFRVALARDSEQPLSHLGLGLALIRQGRLAEGRRSLEIAATLDPTQSLLRSYLGKAFFEERRDARAATQFSIAKELDPTDPTPWLYDALRKQLDNRPVAALRDLERSIELNDDRATFRSRLLLDQDRAVRTASLGRIYQDLGFDQLGRSVAGKATVEDPTSGAAHRLLADLALDAPRQEISRVSDLLKSKLLSPPNTNAVQPSLGFTDLDIVRSAGPARIGFNEYNSLFERDGVRLNANGVVGTEDTLGNELIASGLLGRTALSLGQFHYQTDGSRTNDDIEHDIYNIFGQVGLTTDSSVQVEYLRRYSDFGYRDESLFNQSRPNQRTHIQQDVLRAGGRLDLDPATTLLVSGVYSDRSRDLDEDDRDLAAPGAFGVGSFVTTDQSGTQLESVLYRQQGRIGLQLGGGIYHLDRRLRSLTALRGFGFDGVGPPQVSDWDTDGASIYVQGQVPLAAGLTGVARLGYDWLSDPNANFSTPTPSLGLMWEPTSGILVRTAASRVLKRPLALNATILPTDTVGLTELFDEFDGTRSDQLSLDATWRVTDDVTLGAQGLLRNSAQKLPANDVEDVKISDPSEQAAGLSANWLASEKLVVSQSLAWRRFRQQDKDGDVPVRYWTISAPLDVRYFSPTGIFLGGTLSYVFQDAEELKSFEGINFDSEKRNHLVILDGVIGYRLPRQRGTLALVGRNLLDESTLLQSDDFRSSETGNVLLTGRTVLLQLSLTF